MPACDFVNTGATLALRRGATLKVKPLKMNEEEGNMTERNDNIGIPVSKKLAYIEYMKGANIDFIY